MDWKPTRKRLAIAVPVSAGGVLVTFAMEILVLDSWPWWGHSLAALGCFGIAYAVHVFWPDRNREDQQPAITEGRFSALAPQIEAARRTNLEDPLLSISLTVSLTVKLEALGVCCPQEPANVNELESWLRFLERLHPLAELGRLEQARTLYARIVDAGELSGTS